MKAKAEVRLCGVMDVQAMEIALLDWRTSQLPDIKSRIRIDVDGYGWAYLEGDATDLFALGRDYQCCIEAQARLAAYSRA